MSIPFHLWVALFTWGLLFISPISLAAPHPRGVPTIPQCFIAALSWAPGTGPYEVTIRDQDGVAFNLSVDDGNSLSWAVTSSPGSRLTFTSTDSKGVTETAGPYEVVAGSTHCLDESSHRNRARRRASFMELLWHSGAK